MHLWPTSVTIFAQLLGIATAAVQRELRDATNDAGNGSVCKTQECENIATRIILDMDITVNPCDDFYEYTCGSFLKRNLPNGTTVMNSVSTAKFQFKSQLKKVFETEIAEDDIRPFRLQKILYKACMNEESLETKGVLPLQILTQLLGGWPLLEGASWNESEFDWMATTASWNRAGFSPVTFMKIGIEMNRRNTSQNVLAINSPSWSLKPYHLNQGFNGTVMIRAFYTMMVDLAVSLGADRQTAEDELKEALEFQIELSRSIGAGNSGPLRLTLKTLIQRYPRVDWRDTFARMYSPSQTIGDDDIVIVYAPLFINNVIDLVSRTPKRVLANFAMSQIIPPRMRTMNKETVKKMDAYKLARNNYDKKDPRWISCTDEVINSMPIGVLHMYVKKLFNPETKVKFEDMIQKIRQEFRANFDKVSFLDSETREFVKRKESAIKTIVGYPNTLFDDYELKEYYRNLDLFDDYFFDMVRVLKFDYDKQVREYRKVTDYKNSNKEYRRFLTSIGYTDRNSNSISFSPSALQRGVLNPGRPAYINFATTGTAIGHEIAHLFDNQGIYFNENGDIDNWFSTASDDGFKDQAACLQHQYWNYTEPTIKRNVDGYKTLTENIADNSGVKRAYHAYVKAMSGKAPEKRLPGLNFTPTQTFWIAYGNEWCEKSMPSYLQSTWEDSKHTVGRFRVIGPLSNSDEFQKDFNCKLSSRMNRAEKCSIW